MSSTLNPAGATPMKPDEADNADADSEPTDADTNAAAEAVHDVDSDGAATNALLVM